MSNTTNRIVTFIEDHIVAAVVTTFLLGGLFYAVVTSYHADDDISDHITSSKKYDENAAIIKQYLAKLLQQQGLLDQQAIKDLITKQDSDIDASLMYANKNETITSKVAGSGTKQDEKLVLDNRMPTSPWGSQYTGDQNEQIDSVDENRELIIANSTYHLASEYIRRGNATKAVELLEWGFKLYPNNPKLAFNLYRAYENNENLKDATRILEQLVENKELNKDKRAIVLNNLAWFKLDYNPLESLKLAKMAFNLKPNNSSILDTYAMAMLKNNRPNEALAILIEANKFDPEKISISTLQNLHFANEFDQYVKKNGLLNIEKKYAALFLDMSNVE